MLTEQGHVSRAPWTKDKQLVKRAPAEVSASRPCSTCNLRRRDVSSWVGAKSNIRVGNG